MSDCITNVVKIRHRDREIHGVSYMPQIGEKAPVVIFSHGYNGTNEDFIMNGEYLASHGVGAYCFDFCGGSVKSKSSLNTTEMTIFTEVEDLCAVIDHIKSWEHVDADRIFLFGGSQGGLVTALAAEEQMDRVRGMLLLFPAFCIADDWTNRFPTLESIPDTQELWGMTLGRTFFETIHGYDVFSHIGKFNKNVLIFHGDQDAIVGLAYSKRASQHYPHASFEIFPGEGHGFTETGNRHVAKMTLEFVKANM